MGRAARRRRIARRFQRRKEQRAMCEPGTLVMTTKAVVQLDQPRTARVMGEAPSPGRIWIDLNVMGSHLPQMYRPEELEPATPELAAKHELCGECLGYGVAPGHVDDGTITAAELCQECRGSGSSKFYVEITHPNASTTEARVIPRTPEAEATLRPVVNLDLLDTEVDRG